MVVDTSALFAILTEEPEQAIFQDLIDAAAAPVCSAVSYTELSIVAAGRFGRDMRDRVDDLVASLGVEILAVDADRPQRRLPLTSPMERACIGPN